MVHDPTASFHFLSAKQTVSLNRIDTVKVRGLNYFHLSKTIHCWRKRPVSHLLNLLDILVLAFVLFYVVLFYVGRRMYVLDVHCVQIRTGRHVRCHSDFLYVPNHGLATMIVSSVWSGGGGAPTYRGNLTFR